MFDWFKDKEKDVVTLSEEQRQEIVDRLMKESKRIDESTDKEGKE